MTDPVQHLRELMAKATPGPLTMSRYDHGGGRLYLDDPARRTLVADFFNEGDREFLFALRNLAPQLLEVVESARERQEFARGFACVAEASGVGRPRHAMWDRLELLDERLNKALTALGWKGK